MVMPINHTPEFQKVLRGYKVEEVDEFVSEISAGYEQLRRELFSVKEDSEKLRKQLEYFQALEGSLNKALVAAQQKADEIINNAQDEVNRSLVESRDRLENINTEIAQILAGATEKARQIEEEANRRSDEIVIRVREQVASELNQHNEMGSKIGKIRAELAQSLRTFLQEIEGATSSFAAHPASSMSPMSFASLTSSESFTSAASSESFASPASSGSFASPASSESFVSPASSGSFASPASSEGFASPASSESFASPASSESFASPASSESFASPVSSESLVSPTSSEGLASPASPEAPVSPSNTGESNNDSNIPW